MNDQCEKVNFKNMYEILKKVRSYSYVLLGESTHGTDEYFALRLAITIFLIKDFGYNTILFETDWSLGYQLNLYIHELVSLVLLKTLLFLHVQKKLSLLQFFHSSINRLACFFNHIFYHCFFH